MKAKNFSEHALLQTKIAVLRDKKTPSPLFAKTLNEISVILCALIGAEIDTVKTTVITPLMRTGALKQKRPVVFVPILRAGLGMLDGFLSLMPGAAVGHVGVERDHATLKPRFYYYKTPPLKGADVWVLDPMLATGGSLDFALAKLKAHMPHALRAVSVIASPEGIAHVEKEHPDVKLYTAVVDNKLNAKGYIMPGLGDAGDRYFNT
ncbi:MAG: uracil phosphoribosyltransferase [Leptospiraceae bacterium]|nr:uracil phosphoribosyltransferase [Leptospiraceae bacterium]